MQKSGIKSRARCSDKLANNGMQPTALRAAADAERSADEEGRWTPGTMTKGAS